MLKTRITNFIVALIAAAALTSCTSPRPQPTPTYSPPAAPSPTAHPQPTRPPLPTLKRRTWAGWAILDRPSNIVLSGGQLGPSTTESMIKVAIGAQYLRNLQDAGREPTRTERDLLTAMIQVSDNDAAETLYRRGGADKMIHKVINVCGLHDTHTRPGWWSETTMTPADATRMGACIASGAIVAYPWIDWLLDQMRAVHGTSRFGIIDARPAEHGTPIAIKNGYTTRADGWHVNCLAIATTWVMEVMLRYPTEYGLAYGGTLCQAYADALLPPDDKTGPAGSPPKEAPAGPAVQAAR